jgi:hypothetical protein
VAEVLVQFANPIFDEDGRPYIARACGAPMADDKRWQGWIEFVQSGEGTAIRSVRETTQPNRADVEYWATGLTLVYLEGALRRALNPLRPPAPPFIPPPVFDEPAPTFDPPTAPESILNPFSAYRKGEGLLRSQLTALSTSHLVNIIRAHELSEQSEEGLNQMPASVLVELIIDQVRIADQVLSRRRPRLRFAQPSRR